MAAIEAARGERPTDVEVRCVPPAGISPGEAGVLLRRRTSPADVRATLVDLVARGDVRVLGVLALALEAAGIDDNRTFGALLLLSVPAAAALFLRRRKGRLPAGCAAYHQVLGFKRHLETAGPTVAERFLPWAVAFGLMGGALPNRHGVESTLWLTTR